MALTVVIAVVSQILDAVPQISWLHPYLFTHDWTSFTDLMRVPVDYSSIDHGLLLALFWGLAAGTAAWARLSTRDILS
jgi:ABC-2 type transport system permease protein